MVLVGPYQRVPQTSSRMLVRSTAAPGIGGQQAQQVELLGRQRHVLAGQAHLVLAAVDLQIADHDHRVGLGHLGHAPHDRLDPRDQLAQPERLDHVVVGPQLQADHAVHLLALGRDHDDRHARPGPQLARDGVPVDVGQAQVQQHQVRLGRGEGGGAGGDPLHLEALAAQAGHQRCGDAVVVLHHEKPHGAIMPSSPPGR